MSGSAQEISGLPQERPLGRAVPPAGPPAMSAGAAPSPACRPTSPEWCSATCLWMPGSSSNACRQHRHRTPSPPPGHRDAAGTSLALTNREKAWNAPQASSLPRLQRGPTQARPRPRPTFLRAAARCFLPAAAPSALPRGAASPSTISPSPPGSARSPPPPAGSVPDPERLGFLREVGGPGRARPGSSAAAGGEAARLLGPRGVLRPSASRSFAALRAARHCSSCLLLSAASGHVPAAAQR